MAMLPRNRLGPSNNRISTNLPYKFLFLDKQQALRHEFFARFTKSPSTNGRRQLNGRSVANS